MWRHKTAGKNLQNNFTREWLMGFIFPGDTSPHGTGFSYASRDWFPTTSQLHRAQSVTAHLWVCSPESSRERGRHRSWSAHPPVTLLISLGSTQDEPSEAVLVWFSISQWPLQSHPHVPGVRVTAPTLTQCGSHSSPTFLREIWFLFLEENWAGQVLIVLELIKI